MRRLLVLLGFWWLATPVLAADYVPPLADIPVNWTGFYIGGIGGWDFDGQLEAEPKLFPSIHARQDDLAGATAGGFAAYLYQAPGSQIVIGGEVDGLWLDVKGHDEVPVFFDLVTLSTESRVNAIASAVGKLGIAWGNGLLYGVAGWAGSSVSLDATARIDGYSLGKVFKDDDHWANGVVVGAGIDYQIDGTNWVLGADFRHYSFSSLDLRDDFEGWSIKTNSNLSLDQVTARVGFHF